MISAIVRVLALRCTSPSALLRRASTSPWTRRGYSSASHVSVRAALGRVDFSLDTERGYRNRRYFGPRAGRGSIAGAVWLWTAAIC